MGVRQVGWCQVAGSQDPPRPWANYCPRTRTNSPCEEESLGRRQRSSACSPALCPAPGGRGGSLQQRRKQRQADPQGEQDRTCLRSSSHNLLPGAAQPCLSFSRRGQAQPERSQTPEAPARFITLPALLFPGDGPDTLSFSRDILPV